MTKVVRAALIQAKLEGRGDDPPQQIKERMIEKHLKLIEQAASQGAKIICLQELFYAPYFPAEQKRKWYELAEKIPEGPTTSLMQEVAKKHGVVLIVPMCEVEMLGVYYNTAAVIDGEGKFLGKFRKVHIPHCEPGFWEKFYFRPGNLGYPVFATEYGNIGVYICYDRHFPEGWRILGLNGAEIVFNPSATVSGLSEYLWKLEQPAAACMNIYYVGAVNRPGWEEPWRTGEFYGTSYFVNPRGEILSEGKRDDDDIVIADLDLALIQEVRKIWPFYRDRRPETYRAVAAL